MIVRINNFYQSQFGGRGRSNAVKMNDLFGLKSLPFYYQLSEVKLPIIMYFTKKLVLLDNNGLSSIICVQFQAHSLLEETLFLYNCINELA